MKFLIMCTLFIPLLASFGFGYTNNNGNVSIGEYEQILTKHNSIYLGDNDKVYLTFDTGYELGNTSKILDTLKENDVKATFFVTGHFMKTNPELIKRMHDEGHLVGNHTWGHPKITTISKEKLENEINKINEEYKKITNCEMKKYFRPPCGDFDDKSLGYLDELGYKTIFWSLAYKDWNPKEIKGKEFAYNSVVDKLHNGAIILLHTVSTDNTNALSDIINGIKNKGYKIGHIADL